MKREQLIIGINLGDFGSTGTIMLNCLEYAYLSGNFDVIAFVPHVTHDNKVKTIPFNVNISKIYHYFYAARCRLRMPIMNDGNHFKKNSKNLISLIKKESLNYKKVIIHMHNMHMCDLDVSFFYKWLAKTDYQVLYTLHDCWAYTGGCYCYSHINCQKWENQCGKCPQDLRYTSLTIKKRTNLLKSIKNLTLIPCSNWLDSELKRSRLSSIPTIVNNGECSIEAYSGCSSLKKELGIENKKVVISVSAYWNDWKGIKYLYELAELMPDDYILLLVGGRVNKSLANMIHVDSIKDSNKLAEYYSIADVFVSTTQADNLPLVLMEAQLCGLPVVGFGHGGTPEEITEKSGIMVGTDNSVEKLFEAIKYVVEKKPFKKEDIIASGNRFKKYESAKRQLFIYERICK